MKVFLVRQLKTYSDAFLSTQKLFLPFVKGNWPLILGLFLFTEAFHHYFATAKLMNQQVVSINHIALLGEFSTSLTHLVFYTLIVPLKIREIDGHRHLESLFSFAMRHAWPLFLESIRALAKCLLWALLFVLPGLFFYVRYFFVPFVVLAEPKYQEGKIDALERSNELLKGFTGTLFILLMFLLSLEFIRQGLRVKISLFSNPAGAIGAGLIFEAILIFSNILLFELYRLRTKSLEQKESVNGTHV